MGGGGGGWGAGEGKECGKPEDGMLGCSQGGTEVLWGWKRGVWGLKGYGDPERAVGTLKRCVGTTEGVWGEIWGTRTPNGGCWGAASGI